MAYSYIGFLCVFMAIIVTAQSITCKRCWVNGGTECCKEESMNCTGNECMTITESCFVDNVPYAAIYKTCGNHLCNTCISITSDNFISRISTLCGKGPDSNAKLNYNKTCGTNLKLNGLKCPSCYNKNSMEGCETTTTVKCVGEENACIEFRGTLQYPDTTMHNITLKGCVTKNACEAGFNAVPGVKVWKEELMNCNEPEQDI